MSRKNGGAKYVKSFNGFTHLLTMLYAVIKRFDSLREIEAAMTAEDRKEREARLAAEKLDWYHNILNRFIAEGRAALRAFALTTRTNFNDKEATSIYYGIMAVACKMELSLGTSYTLGIASSVSTPASMYEGSSRLLFGQSGWFPSALPASSPTTMSSYIQFKRSMCCSVSLPGSIKNGQIRLIILSFYTPMKRSIRKILKGFGRTDTSDWQYKNCDT